MVRLFLRNLLLALAVGGGLLAVVEGAVIACTYCWLIPRRQAVLSAAIVIAAVATLLERKLRAHHRTSENPPRRAS